MTDTKGFADHFQESTFEIDAKKTAVLVVDMCSDFCTPSGKMYLPADHLVGPIKKLISTTKEAGGTIIYIKDSHRAGKYDKEFDKRSEHCVDDDGGDALIPDLEPQEEDYVIKKRRFSAFFSTDLDLVLRENKIDTVIVCGVVTNICVRSTVHDAFFLGYDVIVPKETCGATGPREQESSLYDIDTHFGKVRDLEDVLEAVRTNGKLT